MKKILLCLLASNIIYSSDDLEKAILDTNVIAVKKALQNKINSGSLSELQSIQYLDLAEHMIIKRYDQIYFSKKWAEKISTCEWVGLTGFMLSVALVLGTMASSLQYNEKRNITIFLFGTSIASLVLLTQEGDKRQLAIKQRYEDALHIKQIIYESASLH